MSSGAQLLRQLQARKRQQLQQQEEERAKVKHKGDASAQSSSCDDAADKASVAGPSVVSTGAPVASTRSCASSTNSCIDIEVCLGPDCSGGGGGAALLEIEDLISKVMAADDATTGEMSKQKIRVIDGGCRDYCTMGPNVYVRGGIATDHGTDNHFTKVNGPAACRNVIRAAINAAGVGAGIADAFTCSSSGTERILLLREDGRRWRSLRERAATERRLRVKERAPS